jgi:acetyl esterase
MPLHPKVAEMLQTAQNNHQPSFHECTPNAARALMAANANALGPGPALHLVADVNIDARWGTLSARLYRHAKEAVGLMVYLHGGGWCIGTLDDFDALARQLCEQSQCAVLLVDYRLAPEFPFPSGLEDAIDAIQWAYDHRLGLAGGDVPLVVAGDSAGGNLAAVAVNERCQDIPIAKQLLVYPVTDCNFDTTSYRQFEQGYFLTRKDMQWFFEHYAPASQWQSDRICPLQLQTTLKRPSTWIAVADHDVLMDDGLRYAQALQTTGTDVELRVYQGMIHGFIRMANILDTAQVAVADLAKAARQACVGHTPARLTATRSGDSA